MANILMEALRELRQGKHLKESLESDAQRAHDIIVREIFEPRELHEKRWAITTCTSPDGYDYKVIAHVFETEDEITALKEEFGEHAPANLRDIGEWKVSNGVADYSEFDYDGCDLDIYNDEDAISFYFTDVPGGISGAIEESEKNEVTLKEDITVVNPVKNKADIERKFFENPDNFSILSVFEEWYDITDQVKAREEREAQGEDDEDEEDYGEGTDWEIDDDGNWNWLDNDYESPEPDCKEVDLKEDAAHIDFVRELAKKWNVSIVGEALDSDKAEYIILLYSENRDNIEKFMNDGACIEWDEAQEIQPEFWADNDRCYRRELLAFWESIKYNETRLNKLFKLRLRKHS